MFTVEQRDALRERALLLAEQDDRVVAASVLAPMHEGMEAELLGANVVAERLAELR